MLDAEGDLSVPAPSQIDRRAVPSNLDALADLLVDTPVGSLAIVAGDEVRVRRRGRARRAGRGAGRARVRRAAALDRCLPAHASPLRGDAGARGRGDQRRAQPLPTCARGRGPRVHGVPVHAGLGASRHGRAAPPLARRVPARTHLSDSSRHGRRSEGHARRAAPAGARRASTRRRSPSQSPQRTRSAGKRSTRSRRPRSLATARADGPDGGGARAGSGAAPEHDRGRRGDHDRLLRARLPPLDRAGSLLLLQGRRAGLGHARGARRLARPRSRARALRRRRRLGDVLAAGALDSGARAAARRVRGREQPPVPHPQGLPPRHGPRQRQGRSLRRDGPRSSRRSTSSVSLGRWASTRCSSRRPPTSATPCRQPSSRDARTCSSCPSPHRDRRATRRRRSARRQRRVRRQARPRRPRLASAGGRALGRARPERLGQDDAGPHRLAVPASDRAATCVCSERCSGRSTSARCGRASASRARRWPRCCGARSRWSTS